MSKSNSSTAHLDEEWDNMCSKFKLHALHGTLKVALQENEHLSSWFSKIVEKNALGKLPSVQRNKVCGLLDLGTIVLNLQDPMNEDETTEKKVNPSNRRKRKANTTTREDLWFSYYALVVQFVDTNGNCVIPRDYVDGSELGAQSLGEWFAQQLENPDKRDAKNLPILEQLMLSALGCGLEGVREEVFERPGTREHDDLQRQRQRAKEERQKSASAVISTQTVLMERPRPPAAPLVKAARPLEDAPRLRVTWDASTAGETTRSSASNSHRILVQNPSSSSQRKQSVRSDSPIPEVVSARKVSSRARLLTAASGSSASVCSVVVGEELKNATFKRKRLTPQSQQREDDRTVDTASTSRPSGEEDEEEEEEEDTLGRFAAVGNTSSSSSKCSGVNEATALQGKLVVFKQKHDEEDALITLSVGVVLDDGQRVICREGTDSWTYRQYAIEQLAPEAASRSMDSTYHRSERVVNVKRKDILGVVRLDGGGQL
jgi:hypothetical protein